VSPGFQGYVERELDRERERGGEKEWSERWEVGLLLPLV